MFRVWLEELERSRRHWEKFFLGAWSLDKSRDGLGKNVAGFDADRIAHTSEFTALAPRQQQIILNRIAQGKGTVGDLVDIASGRADYHANDPEPRPEFGV